MKHNPKVNEWAARLPGFAQAHPLMPPHLIPGALELMVALQDEIAEITGMDEVCLQPAAGAQGELTGLMMIRACHQAAGRAPRKVFIPDSAHGTNPASSSLNGFDPWRSRRGPRAWWSPKRWCVRSNRPPATWPR
jgi:glycine dehydrogenase subunit 2